jgi:5'-nucleotidase
MKMADLIERPRIFCDCDGVLADFQRHVFDLSGYHPDQIPDDDMWDWINAQPEFWPTMPVKFGAPELWALIKPYGAMVLTGCPKGNYDMAASQKTAWIRQHFGADVQVITCLSRNKPLHMVNPGDILIDDMGRNVRRWALAGGVTVHYRKFDQAMHDLKIILAAVFKRDVDEVVE